MNTPTNLPDTVMERLHILKAPEGYRLMTQADWDAIRAARDNEGAFIDVSLTTYGTTVNGEFKVIGPAQVWEVVR